MNKNMKCENHEKKEAVVTCSLCGTGLCQECHLKLVGRTYCQKCADEIVKEGAIIALRKLYEILEEKRKHHRVYALVSVEITPMGYEGMFLKGIMHNMSSGGMAVLCDKQISINEMVHLNFTLPGGEVLEQVQAGVIRSDRIGEKYNLGFIFMNMLEKQKVIDEFIFCSKKKKYSQDTANISNYLF